MVADQWTAAEACVKRALTHCITLQAEGDIHLHRRFKLKRSADRAVIGGEDAGDSGTQFMPGNASGCHYPILSDVEVIRLLAVNHGCGDASHSVFAEARGTQLPVCW